MEGVGCLLVFFMPLLPVVVERIFMRYCFGGRTFCIIYAVPVAMVGDGSSGGTLFDILS